jgi:hypothetical protein
MTPDATWPNLPSYREFSAADHAAHTSPRGTPYPEDLITGLHNRKAAKELLKVASKPHLKLKRGTGRRKKKQR